MRTINPLDAPLGTSRQKVLSRTHLQPERWWYLHELARSLNLRPSSIQRDAAILVAAGILIRRKDGNRVYFKADPVCPIFPEIRDLLIKTVALVDILRNALKPFAPRMPIAFVYGSMASSEERSSSDVDLMIIGSLRLADVAAALRELEPQVGRSINPTVYSPTEFAKKLKTSNNFLKTVLAGKELFIFGNEDDLGDVGNERARQAP
jgi:DNA-binding transcriptional ArsR family regulator